LSVIWRAYYDRHLAGNSSIRPKYARDVDVVAVIVVVAVAVVDAAPNFPEQPTERAYRP
jgi:hypothetical protein